MRRRNRSVPTRPRMRGIFFEQPSRLTFRQESDRGWSRSGIRRGGFCLSVCLSLRPRISWVTCETLRVRRLKPVRRGHLERRGHRKKKGPRQLMRMRPELRRTTPLNTSYLTSHASVAGVPTLPSYHGHGHAREARRKCVFHAVVNVASTCSDEIPPAAAVLTMTVGLVFKKALLQVCTSIPAVLNEDMMMNGIGMTNAHLQVLRGLFPPPRRTEERGASSQQGRSQPRTK